MGQETGHSEPSSGDTGFASQGAANVSRRAVLRAGTLGAAGAVAAFPALFGELVSGPAASPGIPEAPALVGDTESVAPAAGGLIVAHIRDAATGDISLYVGEREIVYRDLSLVQQLARAAHM